MEARAVLGAAARVVDARRHLGQRIQRIVRQIALRTARFLAQQAHRLQLVQQVAGRFVDVQHAVDAAAAGRLHGGHQRRLGGVPREVVAHRQRVDAGLQLRRVGHAGHALAIDIHHGPVAAQRFAVFGAAHETAFGVGGCAMGGVHGLSGEAPIRTRTSIAINRIFPRGAGRRPCEDAAGARACRTVPKTRKR
jgi:hypothetical protein